MDQFYELLNDVLQNGEDRGDRTGTGTRAVFGRMLRFDLSQGFPLLTGKRVPFRSVVAELLCFLNAKHNVKDFQAERCTIWDEFGLSEDHISDLDPEYTMHEQGDLGPIYGVKWRRWNGVGESGEIITVDQLHETIKALRTHPTTRRALISAWDPSALPDEGKSHDENVRDGKQVLPPCHYAMQFWISKPKTPQAKLNLMYVMRSNDLFLGAPFNIASYALMIYLMANELGIGVGDLVAVTGDTHIYSNHMAQVEELLSRYTHGVPDLPELELPKDLNFSNMTVDAIVNSLVGYNPMGKISAPVAV